MKFLKEDGTIEEGIMLSAVQVAQRQQIEDFLHEKVCANSYHSTYGSTAKCAAVANQLIAILNPSVATGLCHAIDVLMRKPDPEPVPVVDLEVVAAAKIEEAF